MPIPCKNVKRFVRSVIMHQYLSAGESNNIVLLDICKKQELIHTVSCSIYYSIRVIYYMQE